MKEIIKIYLTGNFKDVLYKTKQFGFRWSDIAKEISEKNNTDVPNGEYVRSIWRRIKEQEPTAFCNSDYRLKDFQNSAHSTTESILKYKYISGSENKQKGAKEFTFTADNIPSEQEIVDHFNIDITKWKIVNIYHKTSFGGKYSITVQTNLLKGSEAIDYIRKFEKFVEGYNKTIFINQTKTNYPTEKRDIKNDVLYLVSLSDLHIGNYQKEGYLEKLKERVFQTFKSISESGVSKVIILNTGDILHTNGSNGQTQQGTQLDSQEPFEDAFTQGLDLTTAIIDYASNLSLSVTYVNVRGNHSFDTEYCLGEALKKIYQNQKSIEILNQRDTRIYYYWNNNAFMFTHGDKAVERLPLLFATEGKDFFNKAENHHILLGHTHHNSSKQFVNDRKEYAGIEVRVLGSPTSNDQWHKENGFTGNKKSIVSMLFTPEEGKYAEFNFRLFK